MKNIVRFSLFGMLLLSLVIGLGCKSKAMKHYDKGVTLFQDGKVQEAITQYETGLKLEPKNVQLLYASGWSYLALGQQDRAMVLFGRCLKFDGKFYGGYKGMGSIYAGIGNAEKAEEFFKKALEFDPKNASIYSNLGDVYRRAQRQDDAKKAYEKGVALLPGYADVQNGLIALHLEKGELDHAILLAEESIQKKYRQKFLKGQTFQLLASAYVERAKIAKADDARTKDLQAAKIAVSSGEAILKNSPDFLAVKQELAQLLPEKNVTDK